MDPDFADGPEHPPHFWVDAGSLARERNITSVVVVRNPLDRAASFYFNKVGKDVGTVGPA